MIIERDDEIEDYVFDFMKNGMYIETKDPCRITIFFVVVLFFCGAEVRFSDTTSKTIFCQKIIMHAC